MRRKPATALKVSESPSPRRGYFFPLLSFTEGDLEPGDRAGRAAPAGLLGGVDPVVPGAQGAGRKRGRVLTRQRCVHSRPFKVRLTGLSLSLPRASFRPSSLTTASPPTPNCFWRLLGQGSPSRPPAPGLPPSPGPRPPTSLRPPRSTRRGFGPARRGRPPSDHAAPGTFLPGDPPWLLACGESSVR